MARKQKIGIDILKATGRQKQFNYGEIFRQVRSNIEYSSVDNKVRSIMITSTQADEAKTTVAINLAYTFAAKYQKVLIIDCDLRKRQLAQYMGLSNHYGITDMIFEYQDTQKINRDYILTMNHESFVNDLSIITAGSKVPNYSELLGSKTFKKVIEELKQEFDFIIIDCPPVGMATDCIPVGQVVDGTLYIVSSKDTNKKEALECMNVLRRNNVKILGTVLTKAEVSNKKGYYYYY